MKNSVAEASSNPAELSISTQRATLLTCWGKVRSQTI
jgi:hypothetical protein